ncbi:MAG: hypothetical protein JW915_11790 [Chitinispirillaceae bacterium]|nr:hypothetical protein [Chitinispirillaceae bacterium]
MHHGCIQHILQWLKKYKVTSARIALVDFDEFLKGSLERLSKRWKDAVTYGWYPCECLPINLNAKVLNSSETLSETMIMRIDKKINLIESSLSDHFPHRKKIITEAFLLHREKRYIASVPLFLIQTEGIFSERFTKSFYSRRPDRAVKINEVLKENLGDAFNSFFSQTLIENEFGSASKRDKLEHKIRGPNRNGIMHGEQNHLDYGTRINSYKSISLFAYVGWMASTYMARSSACF